MDKATLLINDYCDNNLSPEERQQLANWLREDPAHVDRLARDFYLHSRIHDLVQQQALQSSAWSQTLEKNEPVASVPSSKPAGAMRKWVLPAAVMAASMAAVFLLVASLSGPQVVAQVTQTSGMAVISNGQPVQAGALLPAGETLQIDRGELLVTFECGAQVLVEAPAVFVVEGKSAGRLTRGGASARVPTQAIGFAINTPLANVIDLGTEFQVRLSDNQQMELHVFDGLVEVRLDNRFDQATGGPLKFSEGRSTRFDAEAGEVVHLDYDETLRREF